MACPVCQSIDFYLKDPVDQFEIYEFKCRNGKIEYTDEETEAEAPTISEDPEIYCKRCSWHGKITHVE
ncbi:MAG: hypothetical protein PVI60_11960 [Desulfobacteraceae bacterium]|jgi:hypothetical protein